MSGRYPVSNLYDNPMNSHLYMNSNFPKYAIVSKDKKYRNKF